MDDVHDFGARLSAGLEQLQQMLEAQQAEAELFGGCAMCKRDMPLTKHHLIPREHQKDFKRKGASLEQLNDRLLICRPCHSAIHRTLDNRALATEFNTLDKLMQVCRTTVPAQHLPPCVVCQAMSSTPIQQVWQQMWLAGTFLGQGKGYHAADQRGGSVAQLSWNLCGQRQAPICRNAISVYHTHEFLQ
jgi:hypothetical protein